MPSQTTSLLILLLTTIPLPPTPSVARGHFSPSALGFPIALTFIPRSAFTTPTPRSWEVARCVQYLVWAWAVVWLLGAVGRTFSRIRRGSLKLDDDAQGVKSASGVDGADEISKTPNTTAKATTTTAITPYISSPLLTTLSLHLISWRLATTLILPDLPGAWKYPFDATTLIGLGVGLICAWGEVRRLLRLTGFVGGRARGGRLGRFFHFLLALHRLLLAIRILSATLDTSEKQGGIAPLPNHVPT